MDRVSCARLKRARAPFRKGAASRDCVRTTIERKRGSKHHQDSSRVAAGCESPARKCRVKWTRCASPVGRHAFSRTLFEPRRNKPPKARLEALRLADSIPNICLTPLLCCKCPPPPHTKLPTVQKNQRNHQTTNSNNVPFASRDIIRAAHRK